MDNAIDKAILGLMILTLVLFLTACSDDQRIVGGKELGPKSTPGTVVIVDTTIVDVAFNNGSYQFVTTNQALSVVNSPQGNLGLATYSNPSDLSLDSDSINITLGSLVVDQLFSNDLNICGVGNDEKCTVAGLRIYNQTDNGLKGTTDATDIVPLLSVPYNSSASSFGVGSGNALILDSIAIAANKKNVKKQNFNTLSFELFGTFTDAGADTFTGTVFIELYVSQ
jgi:hypothetical protein